MKLVSMSKLLYLLILCSLCASSAVQAGQALTWVDLPTGRTLFTSDDIVRFDWDRQLFELTREKAMDLIGMDMGLHRAFAVRDANGDIYQGCFVSSLSSQIYKGAVIMVGPGSDPPLYHIQADYPKSNGASDERFSTHLRDALTKAGKLKPIEDSSRPKPIEVVNVGEWTCIGSDVKAWVDIFPETFHPYMPYRIHIRFWNGSDKIADFDKVSVTLMMTPVADGFVHNEHILSGKITDLLPDQPPFRTHILKAKGMLISSPSHNVRLSFRFSMTKADCAPVRAIDTPEREVEITRTK